MKKVHAPLLTPFVNRINISRMNTQNYLAQKINARFVKQFEGRNGDYLVCSLIDHFGMEGKELAALTGQKAPAITYYYRGDRPVPAKHKAAFAKVLMDLIKEAHDLLSGNTLSYERILECTKNYVVDTPQAATLASNIAKIFLEEQISWLKSSAHLACAALVFAAYGEQELAMQDTKRLKHLSWTAEAFTLLNETGYLNQSQQEE